MQWCYVGAMQRLSLTIRDAIQGLIEDLVAGNFEGIEADGRAGRLTGAEIKDAIAQYGRTLVPPPSDIWNECSGNQVDGHMGMWAVDVPLWTREEGRSDLTLSLWVRDGEVAAVVVNNIRVP